MDLFLLKKIISAMVMPLSITLILLILAIIGYRRASKTGFIALCMATSVLFIGSFAPFSNTITAKLEQQYQAFTYSNVPLDYIIVLGCRHDDDASLPATSELAACSLERLVEAIRIYQLYPQATIITSGFAGHNQTSNAEKVKQAAILLGIPANKILTENFPQDTEEEAELIAPRVLGKQVVLVTSASHMPRAIQYFINQGVTPIPAPASPFVKFNDNNTIWQHYVPKAYTLDQTTKAWHEYLGLIVQWLKQWF